VPHAGATAADDDRVCAAATSSAASRGPARADPVAFAVAAGATAAASSAAADAACYMSASEAPATPCVRARRSHNDAFQGPATANKRPRGPETKGLHGPSTVFPRHTISPLLAAEITEKLDRLPWNDHAFQNCDRAGVVHRDDARRLQGRAPLTVTLGTMAKTGESNHHVMKHPGAQALESALRRALTEAVPDEMEYFHSIQINRDVRFDRHKDLGNFRYSYMAGFGGYAAGTGRLKLWPNGGADPKRSDGEVDKDAHYEDVRHTFLKFNGKKVLHATEPWTGGTRYTVVFFNAGPYGKRLSLDEEGAYQELRMHDSQEGTPWVKPPPPSSPNAK
jgi:hypothetical protein